jgi:predicted ester cyclase
MIVITIASTTSLADEAENIAAVRGMIETINQRDLDGLSQFVSDDVVRHSTATPGVVVTNLAEFRTFLVNDIATMPDSVQHIDIIFGSGDYVAVKARLIATQTGQMGPFPPSGKKIELVFMGILRTENGKVAEIWVEWDNLGALMQMGHIQPPGAGDTR